jgi:hypothetical protein
MTDREIIKLWRSGLTKNKLADIYKFRYNERIKIIRSEMRNRHAGRYISKYEALNYIEKTILNYVRRNR